VLNATSNYRELSTKFVFNIRPTVSVFFVFTTQM